MAEPFKNLFNIPLIKGMSIHFKKHWPEFNAEVFIDSASANFEQLELKQRSNQIKAAMVGCLPARFEHAAEILLASLGAELEDDLSAGYVGEAGISGWAVMPMADYVAEQGCGHFDLSMMLFYEMTKRSSSEFAIRYFLVAMPEQTLLKLKAWVNDENQHVRRLVSEGTRPRLPWGMRLAVFVNNPHPVIALLECLKDDEKEYVRRSVANNLNDIAKDHPDVVADIAEKWLKGASHARKRLVNHACRTLVKNGHKKTLRVLGFVKAKVSDVNLTILTPQVEFGADLRFSLSFESSGKKDQPLMIDYIVHHQKANGNTSPKVFKWRATILKAKKMLSLDKKHGIRKITTRVYYPGVHRLDVVVNGEVLASGEFQLKM